MTDVLNLATGEIITYSLPPREAVKNAYLQGTLKNFNTWMYSDIDIQVVEGNGVCTFGDWSAFADGRRLENG